MENEKRNYWAFIWHAVFLSVTVTFTEINTVIPAMILELGGREIHVGIVTAIMIGLPLAAQLSFAGVLHGRPRKKPFLLAGINARVLALAAIALTVASVRSLSVGAALLAVYAGLTLFTVSGAFAGISYMDLLGKSLSRDRLQRFFPRRQIISGVGILASALVARRVLAAVAYPTNYALLFAAAAAVLLVASGGFWAIRERPAETGARVGALETLASIPRLIKEDPNLRNYILFNNFMGFSVALLPFYVSLAKRTYAMDPALIGNLLFVQILGNILASLLWPRVVGNRGYKPILRFWSLGAVALPLAALALSAWAPLPAYVALFALSGALIGARSVSQDAVTVNLSDEKNRVLYVGAIGTLNLTVALFPLVIGALIALLGYVPVFAGVAAMALAANRFLSAINCPLDQKPEPLS